jgi:hypothetical protein
MTAFDLVCRRLLEVTGHSGHNGSWCCPAHDDRSPSLSVSKANDGTAAAADEQIPELEVEGREAS